MSEFIEEDLSPAEIARQEQLYGPFTQSVRALMDAVIRTEVDEETVRAAQAAIEELTATLTRQQLPASYGIRFSPGGTSIRPWGNVVMGLRNPAAPPLTITHDEHGAAVADFVLGAVYEGPPGLAHGGVSAMLLDHLFGHACRAEGRHGMTGTLTVRYRRGTALGIPLRARAWVTGHEGVKTFVAGEITDADGVTVEATGTMILPRWARDGTPDA